ncbi:MAG: heavy metal translocating P-type ATPase [Gemmatimonadota bacterium]
MSETSSAEGAPAAPGRTVTPAPGPAYDPRGAAGEAGSRIVFRIQKMDCPDCARRIQERLRRVEGVARAIGNPVSRRLEVAYDPVLTDRERIRAVIGRLGYLARDDEGQAVAEDAEGDEGSWRSFQARRTYASATLFGMALVLRLAGVTPPLLSLPVHDLHLPDLFFLASAAVGGWNFFPAGVRAARNLSLDMNFLMTVAILGAVGVGEYLEAAAIAFLFSTAELLESFSVDRARGSIRSLMELAPSAATVLRDGGEVTVAASELLPGELVVVRSGEKVPTDGTVVEGISSVDQAPITGESLPLLKEPGDDVFAGTMNGEGYLRVRVERRAEETTLARIVHLIEEAESRKAPSERFVERFARYYTPGVTGAALLLIVLPPLLFGAPFLTWFLRGLTLLVIACPCAMVISTPVAVVSGITAAARNGVLIKGGIHLEAMAGVRVFAFDKTGTLTAGHPEVTDVVPLDGSSEAQILALAAAVESRSPHPLARAIVRAAHRRGLEMDRREVEGFENLPGKGVRAVIEGSPVLVGRPELFADSDGVGRRLAALRREGKTAIVLGHPERPLGILAVADRAREQAARAIRRLRAAGISRTVMLTGDSPEAAEAIARDLGFDEVHAGLLPGEKVEWIRRLEARYGPVAMVGDGVNDGPALAAATVGVAMGVAGSDTALETADVALMGDDLSRLAYLYRLSHRGKGVIRQNISLSLGLKLGLAAGVPAGLVSLIVAVLVGDMGSSLGVTANSLRLARLRTG